MTEVAAMTVKAAMTVVADITAKGKAGLTDRAEVPARCPPRSVPELSETT